MLEVKGLFTQADLLLLPYRKRCKSPLLQRLIQSPCRIVGESKRDLCIAVGRHERLGRSCRGRR